MPEAVFFQLLAAAALFGFACGLIVGLVIGSMR